MDDGRSELAPNELLALLLLLWGGLRKAEADTLTWDQVYWRGSYIDIRTTPYFSPKTEESKRHIDLDRSILKEILAHKRKGRVFVLPGRNPSRQLDTPTTAALAYGSGWVHGYELRASPR